MTDSVDSPVIFRQEALEHYKRTRLPGDLLHTSSFWTRWGFKLLLLLFCAVIVYGLTATVDEYARGPAFADASGDRIVALLPSEYAARLEPGMLLRVEWQEKDAEAEITQVSSQAVPEAAARATLALPASATGSMPVLIVRATAELSLPADPSQGRAEVRVDSERMLFALVPGLKGLFGEGDD